MKAVSATLRTKHGSLELSAETQVVGILNVTPDSFSDGGVFMEPERACEQALAMAAQGAAMIDIGACSTRPGAAPGSVQEELDRLLPVLERLRPELSIPISVDTFRAEVFRRCHEAGADLLNDVTATAGDPGMAELLAATDAPAILMHMQGRPQTMQAAPAYRDVVADIKDYFFKVLERLRGFGVSWDRIVLDPGIGFGKTLEHNLSILNRVGEFHELGQTLMVGTSRKSFLGQILGRPAAKDRDDATTATTLWLRSQGVQLVRVHNVRAAVDALHVSRYLGGEESA